MPWFGSGWRALCHTILSFPLLSLLLLPARSSKCKILKFLPSILQIWCQFQSVIPVPKELRTVHYWPWTQKLETNLKPRSTHLFALELSTISRNLHQQMGFGHLSRNSGTSVNEDKPRKSKQGVLELRLFHQHPKEAFQHFQVADKTLYVWRLWH